MPDPTGDAVEKVSGGTQGFRGLPAGTINEVLRQKEAAIKAFDEKLAGWAITARPPSPAAITRRKNRNHSVISAALFAGFLFPTARLLRAQMLNDALPRIFVRPGEVLRLSPLNW